MAGTLIGEREVLYRANTAKRWTSLKANSALRVQVPPQGSHRGAYERNGGNERRRLHGVQPRRISPRSRVPHHGDDGDRPQAATGLPFNKRLAEGKTASGPRNRSEKIREVLSEDQRRGVIRKKLPGRLFPAVCIRMHPECSMKQRLCSAR